MRRQSSHRHAHNDCAYRNSCGQSTFAVYTWLSAEAWCALAVGLTCRHRAPPRLMCPLMCSSRDGRRGGAFAAATPPQQSRSRSACYRRVAAGGYQQRQHRVVRRSVHTQPHLLPLQLFKAPAELLELLGPPSSMEAAAEPSACDPMQCCLVTHGAVGA